MCTAVRRSHSHSRTHTRMAMHACGAVARAPARVTSATIGVHDLADLLFLRNARGRRIELRVPALRGTKDIFYFALGLLCKGLVLLHGGGGGGGGGEHGPARVVIDDLDADALADVTRKLAAAGIDCRVDVRPRESPSDDEAAPAPPIVDHARALPEDEPLERYRFTLNTRAAAIDISFRLSPRRPD